MNLYGKIEPEKFQDDGDAEQPVEHEWRTEVSAQGGNEAKGKNPNEQTDGELYVRNYQSRLFDPEKVIG